MPSESHTGLDHLNAFVNGLSCLAKATILQLSPGASKPHSAARPRLWLRLPYSAGTQKKFLRCSCAAHIGSSVHVASRLLTLWKVWKGKRLCVCVWNSRCLLAFHTLQWLIHCSKTSLWYLLIACPMPWHRCRPVPCLSRSLCTTFSGCTATIGTEVG